MRGNPPAIKPENDCRACLTSRIKRIIVAEPTGKRKEYAIFAVAGTIRGLPLLIIPENMEKAVHPAKPCPVPVLPPVR